MIDEFPKEFKLSPILRIFSATKSDPFIRESLKFANLFNLIQLFQGLVVFKDGEHGSSLLLILRREYAQEVSPLTGIIEEDQVFLDFGEHEGKSVLEVADTLPDYYNFYRFKMMGTA